MSAATIRSPTSSPSGWSPGATLEEGLLAFTDTSFGMERMIAVLTEAPPQSEKEDLSFLAQGGVPQQRRGVGGGQPGFSDMLPDIGMAPSTRSVMKLGDKRRLEGRGDDLPDGDGAPAPDGRTVRRRRLLRYGAKM